MIFVDLMSRNGMISIFAQYEVGLRFKVPIRSGLLGLSLSDPIRLTNVHVVRTDSQLNVV